MIEVRSVSFSYRKDWVLQEVSFQIQKGDFIGVIGPNGSGKTTLLKILCRSLIPQRGEVRFASLPLEEMRRMEVAKKIAMVPQESHLLFPFTALEIVLMGRFPYLGHHLFETREDLAIARTAMEQTETLSFAGRAVDELSGGERKRVFIARALAQEPEVILLDEPTANLDIHHQMTFLNLLLTLNQKRGMTIVMASHDINIASEFCDRLILLKGGRLDALGHPKEVITRDTMRRVYGCDVWVDPHPLSGIPKIHLLKKNPTPGGREPSGPTLAME